MKKLFKILFCLCLGVLFTGCTSSKEDSTDSKTETTHTHTYTYEYSEEGHYKKCECGYQSDLEAHSYVDEIIKEATSEAVTGTTRHTCSVCGYSYDETTYHTHGRKDENIKHNSTKHWYLCSCGVKVEEEEHTYECQITKEAVIGTKGTKKYTCSACGYAYTAAYEVDQSVYDQEAQTLVTLINQLTESSSIATINSLYRRYILLNETAQAKVTNYSTLESYKSASIDNIVNPVINAINNLGLVSDSNFATSLSNIETLLIGVEDSLGDNYLDYVTNYDTYTSAKELYETYKTYDLTSYELKQKAIVNAALAYYAQGNQLQYEQRVSRRNVNVSPEYANSYNWTYLDCSSFSNSVFNYVIGYNIISGCSAQNVNTSSVNEYAKDNSIGYEDVIFYADEETEGFTISESEQTQSRAEQIKSLLQVGDFYTYRHGSAGHIMLYIGEYNGQDCFIHSTGNSGSSGYGDDPTLCYTEQQSTNEKNNGTICIDSVDVVFSESGSRYIFDTDNTSWSIIRPLKRSAIASKSITVNGISKLLYPSIDSEKSVSVGNYSSVIKDTNLTYTIKISNTSSSTVNYVSVEENIPSNVTYVSCDNGGIYDSINNKIVWKLSIGAGKTINLKYVYKASGSVGSSIEDYYTYVNGVRLGSIQNEIRYNVDSSTITSKIKSLLGTNQTTLSSVMNSVISDVSGVSISSQLLTNDKYYSSSYYNTSSGYVVNENAVFTNLVPNILAGGYYYRYKHLSASDITLYNNSIRNVSTSYLEPGDIISAMYYSSTWNYVSYLYVDSSTLYCIESGVLTQASPQSSTGISLTTEQFVHTLPYYDLFVIVRPTISNLLEIE